MSDALAPLARRAAAVELSDAQLLRYSRHILLEDIGIDGQQRLLAAHALVLGAGGLGSPVALFLAASGVGRITLVDDDVVDATNLQRQIAHSQATVGQPKVQSAAERMRGLNDTVRIDAVQRRADAAWLDAQLPEVDVVIDCCDNFATRQMLNAACVRHRVPLVSGAAILLDGQLSVYDVRDAASPCYACVFPAEATVEEVRCATMGVFAPLVGIVGSVQAAEALKLLAGFGRSLVGRLLLLDGRAMEWNEMRVARNPECAVCAPLRPAADAAAG